MECLVDAINNTPIIDHHAHNLLLPGELDTRNLIQITTDAEGPALAHAQSSLSHLRVVAQLSKVPECEPTWTAVQASIEQARLEPDHAWAKRCLQGIQTVLIDDGLATDTVHLWEWHHCLVPSPCKKIVRIEALAKTIMTSLMDIRLGRKMASYAIATDLSDPTSIYTIWSDLFRQSVLEALKHPDVTSVKSVICYK